MSLATFVGIATPGASTEQLQKGRRRVAAYASALCLILMGTAAGYQEWIYSGLEFSVSATRSSTGVTPDGRLVAVAPGAPTEALGGAITPLRDTTIQAWFTLGLSRAYFEGACSGRGVGAGCGMGGGRVVAVVKRDDDGRDVAFDAHHPTAAVPAARRPRPGGAPCALGWGTRAPTHPHAPHHCPSRRLWGLPRRGPARSTCREGAD